MTDELTTLRLTVGKMEAALRPFVAAFDKSTERYKKRGAAAARWHEQMPGDWPIDLQVTMQNCRAARALLASQKDKP